MPPSKKKFVSSRGERKVSLKKRARSKPEIRPNLLKGGGGGTKEGPKGGRRHRYLPPLDTAAAAAAAARSEAQENRVIRRTHL